MGRPPAPQTPVNFSDPTDPEIYPPIPKTRKPRVLVFERMTKEHIKVFKSRGYQVICLITLPRETKEDELEYLRLKARGIEEGTVVASDKQIDMLKLQFKAYGLLDENRGKKGIRDQKTAAESTEDIFDLLRDFTPSRHTLDQSTLDFIQSQPDTDTET